MSFLSAHIIGKARGSLAQTVRQVTLKTLEESKKAISMITSGRNWWYPDALATLESIDYISNECCRSIDSALILYKNFTGTPDAAPLQDSLVSCMNEINDFFGSEYLNMNRRLLTVLMKVACDPVQQTLMDEEDSFLLSSVIKDLRSHQR